MFLDIFRVDEEERLMVCRILNFVFEAFQTSDLFSYLLHIKGDLGTVISRIRDEPISL